LQCHLFIIFKQVDSLAQLLQLPEQLLVLLDLVPQFLVFVVLLILQQFDFRVEVFDSLLKSSLLFLVVVNLGHLLSEFFFQLVEHALSVLHFLLRVLQFSRQVCDCLFPPVCNVFDPASFLLLKILYVLFELFSFFRFFLQVFLGIC